MLSVVEHGQRPAPAGEFAGDRGVGDGDAFAAFVERLPAGVQASVTRLARGPVPPDWPDPSGAAAPHWADTRCGGARPLRRAAGGRARCRSW